MMKTISLMSTIWFLLAPFVHAGQVEWNGQQIQFDYKWSIQDWTKKKLLTASIPSGTTIYAGIFSQEEPDTLVFPITMTGVTLIECALDNVSIPSGNIVKTAYREPPKRFKIQNDLRDWVLSGNTPVKVINPEYWYTLGFSTDPVDIPSRRIRSIEEVPKRP